MTFVQPCEHLTPAEQLAAELAKVTPEIEAAVLTTLAYPVLQYAYVDSDTGGKSETWTPNPAYPNGFLVRINQGRPGQQLAIGGRMIDSTDDYRIDYGNDVHLSVRDHLVIGGVTYDLQAVDEISSSGILNTAWAIVAEQGA